MQFQALAALAACLAVVSCRDAAKAMKAIPTITSSLVNLGKMDISFYFNTKDNSMKPDNLINAPLHPSSTFYYKPEPIPEEPCPCSSLKNFKDPFISHPSEILNKILMSNDLFSYNKDPISSTMCCESHEHEDFVTFELGPKRPTNLGPTLTNTIDFSSLVFGNYASRKPPMLPSPKAKAVEIFLFPKKKDAISFVPGKKDTKKDIQIVGDKEIRNDFKNMKFKPPVVSSVKKDLTAQERNEKEIKTASEVESLLETTTKGSQNSIM